MQSVITGLEGLCLIMFDLSNITKIDNQPEKYGWNLKLYEFKKKIISSHSQEVWLTS